MLDTVKHEISFRKKMGQAAKNHKPDCPQTQSPIARFATRDAIFTSYKRGIMHPILCGTAFLVFSQKIEASVSDGY
ncbi:hypothetical protein GCM10009129_03530 [Psychrobacter aestuarii]|uniref:Uncharacterized protein n=1 Tax=Psychrobacter aestuarii TaxID=556327 RepID=A0ABN0VL44_9GAMM